MKKDFEKPVVEGVTIAIQLDVSKAENYWTVHIINSNEFTLENIIVASKGYNKKGEKAEVTSTLRHRFDTIEANATQQIEVITEEVFRLFNEYWVSYFVEGKLYDKKFTFVPESIKLENLTFIKELDSKGVLHA
ncbi:hypothetical protein MNBD_BACTEROID06-864 [hydrothermal vent metagenome]|uniref:Uncharacterized protein n=1 Tax=hydrothermal vent metagenome TaxID=652676 RepID=A0A3B0UIA1_9ZZZZ